MAARSSTAPGPAALAGRALGNLGGLIRDAVVAPVAHFVPREWLVLRIDRGVGEAPRSGPNLLENVFPTPRPLALTLRALEIAREDERLNGVVVRLGRTPLGWGKTSALARALSLLRDSGKKVVAYADTTGNAGAWLGGLADRFWMPPEGRLDLLGIRTQGVFLRKLLDRWQIRPEVIAAGKYKSAAEMIDRDAMSRPAREALEDVVDDLYQALLDGLVAGRARDEAQARAWIDDGPYTASEAVEAGLVDALVYSDELPHRLAALAAPETGQGEEVEARLISESSYLTVARPRFVWHPLGHGRTEISVLYVTGAIRRGMATAKSVLGQLRRAEKDDRVRAVVLRIDSPGGDSLASDLLWRGVRKLAEKKPVVASMGDTAASGGYYVAMAAHEVVAEPTTLTGSIGVVLVGLGFEGLLGEWGVNVDAVQRGRHADLYDPTGRRSEESRQLLRRQVEATYRNFVRKAAECRGMSESDLDALAQGRVWTGAAASARSLVDGLGGIDVALERARVLAGLDSDEGEAVYHPHPSGRWAQMLRSAPLETLFPSPGAQSLCPIEVPLS